MRTRANAGQVAVALLMVSIGVLWLSSNGPLEARRAGASPEPARLTQSGTWQKVTTPSDMWGSYISAVDMISSTEGWAISGRRFLHYAGESWEFHPMRTAEPMFTIAMVSADEGWATQESGVILHYTNRSSEKATS